MTNPLLLLVGQQRVGHLRRFPHLHILSTIAAEAGRSSVFCSKEVGRYDVSWTLRSVV